MERRESRGRCVNIGEGGLSFVTDDRIPVRSYVQFRVDEIRFADSASVRYVNHKGLRYHIGVEFAGGLQWKSPQAVSRGSFASPR